jgi:hypothetical protein
MFKKPKKEKIKELPPRQAKRLQPGSRPSHPAKEIEMTHVV